jgi:hypothetical protein
MARRKQLKGVAGNLSQWCLSRNFDINGYWALGKLYALSELNSGKEVVIDIIESSITPEPINESYKDAMSLIAVVMEKCLESNGIQQKWLHKAIIRFSFNVEYEHKYHIWGRALGQPAIWVTELTTDLGKTYVKKSGFNIWLHNPKKETRRYSF